VRHSLSPFIMNRAIEEFGIDAEYAIFDTPDDRFDEAARSLRAMGIAGVNITYPYKERILAHADRRSPAVGIIGAANAVTVRPDCVEADNTDAEGAARALEVIGGVALAGKKALILGMGGSGRAAAYGILETGAARVVFAARDPMKSAPAVERLRKAFPNAVVEAVRVRGDENRLARSIAEAEIIINATPVGMSGLDKTSGASGAAALIDDSLIEERHFCFEFVYHPRVTPFLEAAARRGARSLDGVSLLVAQARSTFRLWTGMEFSLETMYEEVVEYARHAYDGE
jgi:shikimate dehydrogenase